MCQLACSSRRAQALFHAELITSPRQLFNRPEPTGSGLPRPHSRQNEPFRRLIEKVWRGFPAFRQEELSTKCERPSNRQSDRLHLTAREVEKLIDATMEGSCDARLAILAFDRVGNK
jgi:hypothetical protein